MTQTTTPNDNSASASSFKFCVFFCGIPVPLYQDVFHVGGRGPVHTYFVRDESGAALRVVETEDLAEMLTTGDAARFSSTRPTLTVSERRIPGVRQ